jgi:hypothetical protein
MTSIAFLKVPLNEDRVRKLIDEVDRSYDDFIKNMSWLLMIISASTIILDLSLVASPTPMIRNGQLT